VVNIDLVRKELERAHEAELARRDANEARMKERLEQLEKELANARALQAAGELVEV
jgi:ribosomal protein L29